MTTKKPSKLCGKYKILKQEHKKIDLSLLWRHPLFHDKSTENKANLKREIFRWRTAFTGDEKKIPLVTILSHNDLEDKISLVLVPLLASAGMRCLKLVWSDTPSGQAVLNNLLSLPGVELPSNPVYIHKTLAHTGGLFATSPGSSLLLKETPPKSGLDTVTRFEELCLFALYAIHWEGIVADIRMGEYTHQAEAQNARDVAMVLKEHCEAAGFGCSFFINKESQPLGHALGPDLELQEAIDVLKAKGPLDLTKMALEAGADLLMFSGGFSHRTEAKSFLRNQLLSGAAHARFNEIIRALKGKDEVGENPVPLPAAGKEFPILSRQKGYIQRIAMDHLLDLKQKLCRENRGAGLLLLKKIGDTTDTNEILAKVYLPSSWSTERIQSEMRNIYTISRFPPEFRPRTQEKIKGSFRF